MVSATYQRCIDALDRELSLDPSPETRTLYEKIIRGEFEELKAHRQSLTELTVEQPRFLEDAEPEKFEKAVFVAREPELAQLDEYLELVLAGKGRVVFITGEAGSGKSTLIHEFTQRAQERYPGLIVASGNCNAHTGIGDPYLPFREIMGLLTGNVEARWAGGTITKEHARRLWNTLPLALHVLMESGPDLIDTFIPGSALIKRAAAHTRAGEDWQIRLNQVVGHKGSGQLFPGPQQTDLFEQYTRVLQSLSREIALLLVLDDLQWADAGSIGLLFHLGRQLTSSPILILGAYRQEEVAMGRDGARHPLKPVVSEFQRIFGAISVNLEQAGRRDFVEAFIDSEPNEFGPSFREMVHRQTQGHPLFTIELLRGMQERGDVVQNEVGKWVEGSTLDWETMPARVEAVIAERIGRIDEILQTALQVASVEGEVFTAEVLSQVLETSERALLGRLSGELDRRHRLIRAESIQRLGGQLLSNYRFRHILFQKYLYSSLDEVERVHLHEQVGFALERLYAVQEEIPAIALQLARHFEEAGNQKKAIHYLHQAGKKAIHLSAYQEGIAHLTRGLELIHLLPASPERDQQELELLLSFALAWKYQGPKPQLKEAIDRTHSLCQRLGKTAQLSRVLSELLIYHYVQAEYKRALELGIEALSLAQQAEDPVLEAESHWALGFLNFCLGDYTNSRTHLKEVISFYKPEQHHRPLVRLRGVDVGLSAMAYDPCCLWCLGYPDQAFARSQEVLALARKFNHPFTLADALSYAGCMFNAMRKDPKALKANAEELMRVANEGGIPAWLGSGTSYLGEALALEGRTQEGITQIRQGIRLRQSANELLYKPGTLRSLAKALAEVGDRRAGLDTLDEALRVVEQTGERHWEVDLHTLRAVILVDEGDVTGAEASYGKALEVSQSQKAKSWELRAATGLAKLWKKQGKAQEARDLLEPVYAWFTEGFDTPDLKEARALLDEISEDSS
jgi:predicted ATPase/energy-coupling factor transporter ATP-binding protein EcfA2